MEEVEVTFTHFCEICGRDIDISKDKYLWEPLKGLKLFWRRLFGGLYGKFYCQSCQRDKKIYKILKN
jgi:hypothetical protein